MKAETAEEKIRKIQSLFLDQVEIRIGSDTESAEGFPTHKIWWCDVVYVDDDYKDNSLSFIAESQTILCDNISAAGLNFATETTLVEALDGLYELCVMYIKHRYIVYTDDFKIIAVVSSATDNVLS